MAAAVATSLVAPKLLQACHSRNSHSTSVSTSPNLYRSISLSDAISSTHSFQLNGVRLSDVPKIYNSDNKSSTLVHVVGRSGGRPSGPRPSPRPPMHRKQPEEPPKGDLPIINEQIKDPLVRLIGENQTMLGIFSIQDAMLKASDQELDLVMIAPEAEPPVVRIMDFSKYRYELQKKKRDQQKKAAASKIELKELKIRYNIDTHDYAVRLKAAQKFLSDGDKVKLSIQFKGREMEFKDLGFKLIDKFKIDLGELASIEGGVNTEGRTIQAYFSPNKATRVEKIGQEKKPKKDKTKLQDDGDEQLENPFSKLAALKVVETPEADEDPVPNDIENDDGTVLLIKPPITLSPRPTIDEVASS